MDTLQKYSAEWGKFLTEMNENLSVGTEDLGPIDKISRILKKVGATISELRELALKLPPKKDIEVAFFKVVWPKVYSLLYYHQRVWAYLQASKGRGEASMEELRDIERGACASFFDRYGEFWAYCVSDAKSIDHQFSREHANEYLFDPVLGLIDPLAATIGSQKVALWLAHERFVEYLDGETGGPGKTAGQVRFEWNESLTAAVEMIKAQAEAGSISIDGKPATAAQLKADWEQRYGIDLKDFDKLLYAMDARKGDPASYMLKLTNAIEGRRKRLRK